MRKLFLSALVLAAIAASGAAHAQPGLSSKPNLDGADNANRIAENALRKLDGLRRDGLEAMQKGDYTGAEKYFAKMLAQTPTTNDAPYLMGLAKMGQQAWPDAKQYLEQAVKGTSSWPDPKARLGVTLIKLNDVAGANQQRADLAALQASCNGCKDAARITENLALLDRALANAAKPAAAPAPASAPAPATPPAPTH